VSCLNDYSFHFLSVALTPPPGFEVEFSFAFSKYTKVSQLLEQILKQKSSKMILSKIMQGKK
jgi:hypothetical protein